MRFIIQSVTALKHLHSARFSLFLFQNRHCLRQTMLSLTLSRSNVSPPRQSRQHASTYETWGCNQNTKLVHLRVTTNNEPTTVWSSTPSASQSGSHTKLPFTTSCGTFCLVTLRVSLLLSASKNGLPVNSTFSRGLQRTSRPWYAHILGVSRVASTRTSNMREIRRIHRQPWRTRGPSNILLLYWGWVRIAFLQNAMIPRTKEDKHNKNHSRNRSPLYFTHHAANTARTLAKTKKKHLL